MSAERFRIFAAAACLAALLPQTTPTAAQTMPAPDIQQKIDAVCACLMTKVVEKDDPHICQRLQDRMAASHVPGVSIAVIHDGAIEWAQGFGVAEVGGRAVTAETLFQAGSISKPVAAMAALRLVEQGRLALDADVNHALTSWKLPANTAAPGAVTLRQLLSHTAGLTVHGFPGYAAGAALPSLVQILNGEPPANTAPVRIEAPPGSRWKYSGGGYTIAQLLLEGISRQSFPQLMQDTVLGPIGMRSSTYEQPLPVALRSGAATPYRANGTPIPGGFHTYPEMAAAGLWSTPTDLARYVIEVQRSLRGDANHVLSAEMTREMLTPGLGRHALGLPIGGSPDDPFFSHGGIDAGFEAILVGYQQRGEGAIVMTNAQGGQLLAGEILRSIAHVYGWPDLHPIVRSSIAVDPALLATYAGVYQLTPTFAVTITLEGGKLMSQATGQGKIELFAEAPSRFFVKPVDAPLEFFTASSGQITHLVLHQNGQEMRGERKP